MTKTSPSVYAAALYEFTENLSGAELDQAISQFIRLLTQKKDLHLINKIITFFEEIYNQKNDIAHLEIKSARKLPEKTLQQIKSVFKKELSKKVEITEMNDRSLIGGFSIQYQDTIIDASLSGTLANLKKSLTK